MKVLHLDCSSCGMETFIQCSECNASIGPGSYDVPTQDKEVEILNAD